MMTNADKELVFSESVKAGKRIYYFDVKQSRNGDKYVAITESKKIVSGPEGNPQISYEKHKVFLYKEDFEKFTNALNKAIDVATTGVVPAEETETAEAETVEPVDSNIDIQF
ncbi:MAG: PUR family DNA/RNA-binding protein [Bacteroidaceae bacterium]|nr:PUR family DNA/RNA-binding protein [Bacteroidaceae bacterium]